MVLAPSEPCGTPLVTPTQFERAPLMCPLYVFMFKWNKIKCIYFLRLCTFHIEIPTFIGANVLGDIGSCSSFWYSIFSSVWTQVDYCRALHLVFYIWQLFARVCGCQVMVGYRDGNPVLSPFIRRRLVFGSFHVHSGHIMWRLIPGRIRDVRWTLGDGEVWLSLILQILRL